MSRKKEKRLPLRQNTSNTHFTVAQMADESKAAGAEVSAPALKKPMRRVDRRSGRELAAAGKKFKAKAKSDGKQVGQAVKAQTKIGTGGRAGTNLGPALAGTNAKGQSAKT